MATRSELAKTGNGWKRRLAFIVGACLVIVWAARGSVVPDPNSIKVQGADTVGNPVQTAVIGQSSANSLQSPFTNTATGAATAITASINGVAGKTTYISGFIVTGGGATAASNITVTITNTVSSNMTFTLVIPAGATTSIVPLAVNFSPAIPANALATTIQIQVPSFGAGNTNATVTAWGWRE